MIDESCALCICTSYACMPSAIVRTVSVVSENRSRSFNLVAVLLSCGLASIANGIARPLYIVKVCLMVRETTWSVATAAHIMHLVECIDVRRYSVCLDEQASMQRRQKV